MTSLQEGQVLGIEVPWDTMAWTLPLYTKGQVDKAGKQLVESSPSKMLYMNVSSEVLDAVHNWRFSHILPLYVIRKTLERRAKKISATAIVSHRIKRLPSIENKLQENAYRNLRLTKIEDIGGCRAVLPTIDEVYELLALYCDGKNKSEMSRARDYVLEPKTDGYRSIHLVYKYYSDREQYRVFNGHRIEIQIRSQLQHTWATAVEMLWTFAGISVKQAPGQIPSVPRSQIEVVKWSRFFVLMGSAMALREGQPSIPTAPFDRDELRALTEELHVQTLLPTWSVRVSQLLRQNPSGATHFLMHLDPRNKTSFIEGFRADQIEAAFAAYVVAEQLSPPTRTGTPPSSNVVLVSVDSLAELRSAYPNYYGDTQTFCQALGDAVSQEKH
jgi:hypothetical protein